VNKFIIFVRAKDADVKLNPKMKKLSLKLATALLAVVLVASVSIFYACEKKEKDNNSEGNLKKEAEFVAKIHEEMWVQVNVYRDENNNAHITTKEVAADPEIPIGIIIPEALNIEPSQAKNDDGDIMIEIPNDAIYWVVPLDGNEPIKFEPVNGAKDKPGGNLKVSCKCTKIKNDCTGESSCGAPYISPNGKLVSCLDALQGCCQICAISTSASGGSIGGGSYSSVIPGSSYLVQSNTITINGTTYE